MVPLPNSMLGAMFLLLCVAAAFYHRRARASRSVEWADLVARMVPVANAGVVQIATDYLRPRKNQIEVEPAAMFEMLGGMAGLNAMYENSKVILALAGHTTQWNYEEGVIVTEKLRRDALRLQRTITLIQLEMHLKHIAAWFRLGGRAAFRLEEVAGIYYRMTLRLAALYETSHSGLYPRLLDAL